jgi:hypothetical protein
MSLPFAKTRGKGNFNLEDDPYSRKKVGNGVVPPYPLDSADLVAYFDGHDFASQQTLEQKIAAPVDPVYTDTLTGWPGRLVENVAGNHWGKATKTSPFGDRPVLELGSDDVANGSAVLEGADNWEVDLAVAGYLFFSVFAVKSGESVVNLGYPNVGKSSSANTRPGLRMFSDGASNRFQDPTQSYLVQTTTTTYTPGNKKLTIGRRNAALTPNTILREDGTLTASADLASIDPLVSVNAPIFGDLFSNTISIYIAEWGIIDAQVSDAELTTLESYLINKWGLT